MKRVLPFLITLTLAALTLGGCKAETDAPPEERPRDPGEGHVVFTSDLRIAYGDLAERGYVLFARLDGNVANVNPSPDGRWLLYSGNVNGQVDLYLVDTDTQRDPIRITNTVQVERTAVFSPDGSLIALEVEQGGGDFEIYVMEPDGSGLTNVSNYSGFDVDPIWSPNGSTIAFVSTRGGEFDIFSAAPDGSGVTRLSDDPAQDLHPAWSPDGRRIAFTSDRSGSDDIWVMDADGGNPTPLTSGAKAEFRPTWSPDGKQIVYLEAEERFGVEARLIVLDVASGQARAVYQAIGKITHVSWSLNGLWLAFSEAHPENPYIAEVVLMNADGTGAANITNNNRLNTGPVFGP
jgi:TolB protein